MAVKERRLLRTSVVPKGFKQTVPNGRKVPTLTLNEDYRVWVNGGGSGSGAASFVYQGVGSRLR
jgi:hypothetical protein